MIKTLRLPLLPILTAYGLGLYEQMGSGIRAIRGEVESADDGSVRVSARLAPGEAAGPVVAEDGRLVGFLAGRTDVTADGGGANRMIPVSELAALIKQARRPASDYGGSFGRPKRKAASQPVAGKSFVVYATMAEEFTAK